LAVKAALEFRSLLKEKGKQLTRTNTTPDHQNIGTRACERDGNEWPYFEGVLSGRGVWATLARRVGTARWGFGDLGAETAAERRVGDFCQRRAQLAKSGGEKSGKGVCHSWNMLLRCGRG
jgi:hypothetical protein